MAVKAYKFTALTGGAASALDSIDGGGIALGSFAFTLRTTNQHYIHEASSSALSLDSPRIIPPANNPGSIRWILKGGKNHYVKTMSGDEEFLPYSDHLLAILTPNGSARIFDPTSGTTFPSGYATTISNVGSEVIIFDSNGINASIAGGDLGLFFCDGTTWS